MNAHGNKLFWGALGVVMLSAAFLAGAGGGTVTECTAISVPKSENFPLRINGTLQTPPPEMFPPFRRPLNSFPICLSCIPKPLRPSKKHPP